MVFAILINVLMIVFCGYTAYKEKSLYFAFLAGLNFGNLMSIFVRSLLT